MRFLYKSYFWIARQIRRVWSPLTVGVRALVVRDDEVLLVRMTYVKGWALPGGGVDPGETVEAATVRELYEETGLKAEQLTFFGLYFNSFKQRNDHVAVYTVETFTGEPEVMDPAEIEEVRFFKIHQLPADLRGGHRRRIEEYLRTRKHTPIW